MSHEVVVVVGAGGMGQTIAKRVGAGRRVLLADFNEDALDVVASSMHDDGYLVEAALVDVAHRASIDQLANQADRLGAVRYVVHTAGLSPAQASVEAILAVDVLGVAYSLDAFGRVITEGGSGIYIASMAGSLAVGHLPPDMERELRTTQSTELLELDCFNSAAIPDGGSAYAVAKRANQLRVEAASVVWGKRGARVNSVSPGVISTAMGQQELSSESGDQMRQMIEHSGTGRIGTSNDIADAAAFLLGADASFITGTDVLVDGGVVAAVRMGALEIRPS